MNTAEQLADRLERRESPSIADQQFAAAELRRLSSENESLKAEMLEQCRIIGMSGSKEARLLAENAALKADRDSWIEQCSQRVDDWHKEHLMVDALRKDAERYRWLRNHNPTRYAIDLGADIIDINCKEDGQRELDAAIDAAMKYQGNG